MAAIGRSSSSVSLTPNKKRNLYYYYNNCPLESDCSSKSFKQAKCNGKSQRDAREALVQHLTGSSLHGLEVADARRLAEQSKIDEAWMTDDEADGNAMQLAVVKQEEPPPRVVADPPLRAADDSDVEQEVRIAIADAVTAIDNAKNALRVAEVALEKVQRHHGFAVARRGQ